MSRLELLNIRKAYPSVVANDDVSLRVAEGEIHAVLGENGAGKSTLMKIIYGATQPDAGTIVWNGQTITVASPAQARALGISMVYQHFSLFGSLTVAENVWLGLDTALSLEQVKERIGDMARHYGLELEPDRPVHTLSVGECQRVEIVRALLTDPQLLSLDEPNSVPTPHMSPGWCQLVWPGVLVQPAGVHFRWPDKALEQEARLFDYKWYAALAYIRANKLNHNVIQGPNDRFGLIASGKAYNDTRQALLDLGLDDATCQRQGIRVHKVGVVWPLESQTTRAFATGLREIMVVEEKRQIIEYQLKETLYNWRDDVRPTIVGKFDETDGDTSGGEWSTPNPTERTLLRANADLTPALIARAIAKRLKKQGLDADTIARIDAHLAVLDAKEKSLQTLTLGAAAERTPWFCSGCPHNTSTKVPEGSRAMAGIGCHFMSLWMDRRTTGFTQMGGEGVPWSGQQPFCTDSHIFANNGDGTYFHSGILAVRQSVASGVNITYKILYNDAVAMTGGQPVGERAEGHSVVQIAMSMKAEGAQRIVVVTDEPEKYEGVALAEGVRVFHRDELDRIQREMREIKGTTVIIYDQTCATEKRRRRKRGTMVDPAVRVMINEQGCEGWGDCGVQSNCLSNRTPERPLGR